jgi:uncharacterized membrane protein
MPVENPWERRSRVALATLLVVAGVAHFVVPEPYRRIIPKALGSSWSDSLVYLSGAAEVVGGAMLVHPAAGVRRPAGWFVAVLLVVVFPANVQMAVDSPNVATILRLPLQVPLVWLAWRQTRR